MSEARDRLLNAFLSRPEDLLAVLVEEGVLDETVCGTCRGEFWHKVRNCPACDGDQLFSFCRTEEDR